MMKEGDFEGAVELLEKAIEGAPGVTAPYIDLAEAYAALERPEPAEEVLKTALELFPGHPAASNEYGLLLRKSGRFAEAREIYQKTLAQFPEYLPARRNLGILCDLYLGDPAAALEQYEIYSAARPEDEQIKLWIADLRLRLGR
jgi:Tfp pilus assembly protein PilF